MTKVLIMYSNESPSPNHVKRLEAMGDGLEVMITDSEASAIEHAAEAEIILGHRYLWQTLPVAKKLLWVQSTASGIDALLVPDLLIRHPLLSRNPISSDVVALHALAMAMSLSRRLAASSFALGAGHEPERTIPLSPPCSSVIYGMGAVGCELGRLLQALGCQVFGVRRTTKCEPLHCERLLTPEVWKDSLAHADSLFICAPLTSHTRRVINAKVLERLPRNAILVNIARGGLVDHTALAEALENGHLAGAGLDTVDGMTDVEKARLLKFPNVIYTPKTAALFPKRQERLETFIESQVERYLSGFPPLHLRDYSDQDILQGDTI